ncbi:MAG: redoxin domain-containing protein [Kineosporiaceae bacterium]|nr:redoxin domain-containing protein [Kineosporiaceae bacterium]
MTFATKEKDFEALNTELVGRSVDGLDSHAAWLRTIKEKIDHRGCGTWRWNLPLIDDVSMKVATKYGMIMPGGEDTPRAVRAVFVIDRQGVVRAIFQERVDAPAEKVTAIDWFLSTKDVSADEVYAAIQG